MVPERVPGQEASHPPQNHYQTVEGNKDSKEEKANEREKRYFGEDMSAQFVSPGETGCTGWFEK